jgi:hypothetical protein
MLNLRFFLSRMLTNENKQQTTNNNLGPAGDYPTGDHGHSPIAHGRITAVLKKKKKKDFENSYVIRLLTKYYKFWQRTLVGVCKSGITNYEFQNSVQGHTCRHLYKYPASTLLVDPPTLISLYSLRIQSIRIIHSSYGRHYYYSNC